MNPITNAHNLPIPFAAYKGKERYVFISYAHKDSTEVFPIISQFNRQEYHVWYDEGIEPGIEWPEEIANALNNSSLFVVFITPNSVNSENVRNEINFALAKKTPFIAIHLSPTTLTPGLQLQIGSKQAILRYQMDEDSFTRKYQYSFDTILRPEKKPVPPIPPITPSPAADDKAQPVQKVAEPSAPFEPTPTAGAIVFKSDLVRRAACAKIGLPEDRQLESKHALAVTELRLYANIFGDNILHVKKSADHIMVHRKIGAPEVTYDRGDLSDLNDLRHFHKLAYLELVFQQFSDLSGLGDLNIKSLDLSCNRLDDLTPLAKIQSLNNLKLDYCSFSDLRPLENCAGLAYLSLLGSSNAGFQQLCSTNLPHLTNLTLSESKIESLDGIARFKLIDSLQISNSTIFEFGDLASLQNLQYLLMIGTKCFDFSFLKNLPNLRSVSVDADQKPAVIELFGGSTPEFLK